MDESIESLIQYQWEKEYCPCVEGILFDTGDIILMRNELLIDKETYVSRVHPLARTTLASFLEFNPDFWTSIGKAASTIWAEGALIISCGEGGSGADGFVAASRISDKHLIWLAFFQSSNPFNEVKVEGTNVIAVSTYGHEWTFPVWHPERVSVRSLLKVNA